MPSALVLPGTSGNYASAPDSAALSITGDITLLCRVALDDWTPAAAAGLIAKWTVTGNQLAYRFLVNTDGTLSLRLSNDGSTAPTATSSQPTGITDGAAAWVLVSWRNSDDRVQFFTASGTIADPAASDFTQLGSDQTLTLASIKDSTAVLEIGSSAVGTVTLAVGKFYRAKIYNGVFSTAAFGGTLQFDSKFMDVTATAVRTPSSFTESSSNAATVTVNGSAWAWQGGVNLTPGTAALTAPALDPVPQPITVSLTPATVAFTGIAVDPVPQPVTVALTPASVALSAVAVDPQPQPVTVALAAAETALVAIAVDPQPQPVTVALVAASVALSAVETTPVPQPVRVDLTSCELVLDAVALDPQPQPVEVELGAAELTLTAVEVVAVPPASEVTLTPAEVVLEAPATDPQGQPVQVALTVAVLTLTALTVDPVPQPVTVNLTVATVTLAGVALSPQPQPVTVALTVASFTITAVPTSPVPQPVVVALTRATLALTAVPLTAIPGVVEMTLTPAVIVLAAVAGLLKDRNPRQVSYTEPSFSIVNRDPSTIYRDPTPDVTHRDPADIRRRESDLVYQEG